ncbi:MAG: hypothetical protein B6229_00100 [Spirochaetaceae bacterium 4572_7]|nr:MAG: hypothetical protein B6229_00100 [Spirochaetaceae bacterium 4572_7]
MNNIYAKYLFDLPIIPKVVSDILKIPGNSQISSKEIQSILEIDQYLTARLLKIANSSYYVRQEQISSIKDAVTLIGLNKIKAICLLIAGSEIIENKNSSFFHSLWEESINTAFIAKEIATKTGRGTIADDIFTGGILHNIGQAILYNFSNEKYDKVLLRLSDKKSSLETLEQEEFGINNHSIATEVLKSWEFPKLHIDIVNNYSNLLGHSNFQNAIDIISISKLINIKITGNTLTNNEYQQLLTYQSRLNLRKSQMDYFINDYFDNAKKSPYYKICTASVN